MRSTLFAALLALAAPILSASASAAVTGDSSSSSRHFAHAKRALAAPPLRSRHASRQSQSVVKRGGLAHSSLDASAKSRLKAKSKSKKAKRGKCKSKSSSSSSSSTASSPSSSNSTTSSNPTSSSTSSSGSGLNWDVGSDYLKIGNIYAGFLPDDGSGGGTAHTLASINAILPAKSVWYGRYAQVTNGKTFDGSQLYQVLDDVKASGAILAASVMPYKTWYGLTESDNSNAVAIAKVCADIYENHGVEVWLRFGHEMNWYLTDGTYTGSADDFQTGWKVLSAAIEQYAPDTKLWWSPNVGSDSDYEKYYPKEGRVDVVGFDWYPTSASDSFVDKAKSFHDKYTSDSIVMVQGETGLHYTGSNDERMEWVKQLSSDETQAAMPNYLGWMWFNYDKYENGQQIDFRIVEPAQSASSGVNAMAVSYFSQ